jgi:hypothetical protein
MPNFFYNLTVMPKPKHRSCFDIQRLNKHKLLHFILNSVKPIRGSDTYTDDKVVMWRCANRTTTSILTIYMSAAKRYANCFIDVRRIAALNYAL